MANTKKLFGAGPERPAVAVPPLHLFRSPKVEPLISQKQNDVATLSPEILYMAKRAKEHYLALGAMGVYGHVMEVLGAAVRGKLILPSTNGADPFSRQVAELILYHSLDSESHLPNTAFSPGFERRLALHTKIKNLDSQGGERSAQYVSLLNDKSSDLTDLLVVLYTRIADMMTVHNPATSSAAEIKMPGIFPVHGSWDDVKAAWAEPMLRIYCPIADWGGQTTAYRQMRDNAIRYLHQEEFFGMLTQINRFLQPLANTTRMLYSTLAGMSERLNLRVLIAPDYQSVSKAFSELDDGTVAVAIRPFKGVGGLLNKSLKRGIPVELVHDWSGATVIAENEGLMYDVVTYLYENGIRSAAREVGVTDFHSLEPKDYVLDPKPVTQYQSVHLDTVGRDPNFVPLEMIVRTADMHRKADEGTAGHDVYKLSPLVNGERRRFTQRLGEITTSF